MSGSDKQTRCFRRREAGPKPELDSFLAPEQTSAWTQRQTPRQREVEPAGESSVRVIVPEFTRMKL